MASQIGYLLSLLKMWVWALNQECFLKGGYVPVVSPPSPPVFFPHALNIQTAGASGNEAMRVTRGPPPLLARNSWRAGAQMPLVLVSAQEK